MAKQQFTEAKAVDILNQNRPSWRRHLVEGDKTVPLCISPFALQAVGTVQFVVWNDTSHARSYLLLTCQERTIQGKKQEYAEPPAGFFNPDKNLFGSNQFSPQLIEEAEREIEEKQRLGIRVSNQTIYEIMRKKVITSKETKFYVKDANLWDTGRRECLEETGFSIEEYFQESDQEEILSTFTNAEQNATVLHCLTTFNQAMPPPILGEHDDEVKYAFWCPIEDIDMEKKMVLTPEGHLLPIKPTANILEPFKKVYARCITEAFCTHSTSGIDYNLSFTPCATFFE